MRVDRIAVIGAGTMGRGIAYTAILAGFQVALHDIDSKQLTRATEDMNRLMERRIELQEMTPDDRGAVMARLRTTTDLKVAVGDADVVIEAVLERMEVKVDVFAQLDALCPPHTIFATNTSTMSPTEIGAATTRPRQTIAMHFFNPVHRMKLVEIVRGLDTDDDTFETAKRLATRMGKESVEVNEFPGFVTSRISCLVGNEAMKMLQEGVASAQDIDKAIQLGLNYPMGPLALADLVGLDSRLRNMQYLHQKLGETYRPAPILEKYVKAGRLGRKTGRGFFDYASKS
ncbi:3-hydroxyacyl-CoA dehydrogenase [Alicyclobacillus fastidiosus]|uniref:3-hydroxyacyl-CoA dehydrogenase n=1 Tax=Alicyclobacillus fastidiosus TaxID=392011 RepID=A0ABY6ZLB3_9BACL|nr:3-hydroxyacyl-CoA dehydrogenase [Alicyclobacillus fastidiosus]WAH43710.1 3-hydroxyacyl-CoA dehydrogenase [Alicyclobacillus fastidiosus]